MLAELGRTDEALSEARELIPALEAAGQTGDVIELRTVELTIRVGRGEQPARAEIDHLVERARAFGHVDDTPYALAAAAGALAADAPERARALLTELLEVSVGSRRSPYFMRMLPGMARTAVAAGDPALAERLLAAVDRHYPLDKHALCAGKARLAEHAGELPDAVRLYEDAAERWRGFGNAVERAHALAGLGRCRRAGGPDGADEALREARALFDSMGFTPAVAEIDALLRRAAPAAAS